MYEFEIVNKATGEHEILTGRNYKQTMTSAGLDTNDYTLVYSENIGGFGWL